MKAAVGALGCIAVCAGVECDFDATDGEGYFGLLCAYTQEAIFWVIHFWGVYTSTHHLWCSKCNYGSTLGRGHDHTAFYPAFASTRFHGWNGGAHVE